VIPGMQGAETDKDTVEYPPRLWLKDSLTAWEEALLRRFVLINSTELFMSFGNILLVYVLNLDAQLICVE